ncbi:MAG: WhiB family transcriptional regulator [Rhodococcus sp. (in: high G+C Gram-positive bacteria)]|nr:WhiB family transcriptional regulator [Rhodococcus sp. (in: high G+C Gram-positive bacteria)]MDI6630176.1 WhiB family transcriptional regulator [Rhodococcus sp. (in: high G+C Gram-positive bacteria)]
MRNDFGAIALPRPTADVWDWQLQASCRDHSTRTFFPPRDLRERSRTRAEEAAKQICRPCPVRGECLRYALDSGEPYGVWGGLTPIERFRLRSPVQPASPVERAEQPTTQDSFVGQGTSPAASHSIGTPRKPYLKPARDRGTVRPE